MISNGNTKLYHQLYIRLRSDIFLGKLQPGSELPSIENIGKKYGVSQPTVRRAMDLLEKEKLIIRKQGRLTFISEHVDMPLLNRPMAPNELESFHIEIISSGWIKPSRRLMQFFGDDENAYLNDKIFRCFHKGWDKIHQRVKAISSTFFPYWRIRGIDEEDLWRENIFETIAQKKGMTPFRGTEIIRPWICDVETAELLDVPNGIPVFYRTWIRKDEKDRVIQIDDIIATSNAYIVKHGE